MPGHARVIQIRERKALRKRNQQSETSISAAVNMCIGQGCQQPNVSDCMGCGGERPRILGTGSKVCYRKT
jgi:hypothetical protein